ncbi:hypothetical protein GCM10028895_43900 [Pontibacter rugosus]
MKTHRLHIEYNFGFDVYGLVSSSKDYKLAWILNKLLNLHLIKSEDLCYNRFEKNGMLISNFEYRSENNVVRLLKNKALGSSSLKSLFCCQI